MKGTNVRLEYSPERLVPGRAGLRVVTRWIQWSISPLQDIGRHYEAIIWVNSQSGKVPARAEGSQLQKVSWKLRIHNTSRLCLWFCDSKVKNPTSRKVYFDVSSNSLCFLFLAEMQWHWECPLLARVASPTFWSRSMASPYPRTASVDSCCAKSGVGSTPFSTFSKRIQEVKLCTYSCSQSVSIKSNKGL